MKTTAIILDKYPDHHPRDNDVKIMQLKLSTCVVGEVLVRLLFLSVDPYIRNRLRPNGTRYIAAIKLGEPIVSMGIGEVIDSQAENFKPGDIVIGMLPWQKYCVINAGCIKHVRQTNLTITTQLGVLGYPGFTAYIGICHLAKPMAGQTVFISSAAGAVGSLAGQLAKLHGCYTVGCASTDEKINYLINELHYDSAFNYHKYKNNYVAALREHCPLGIDVNFENVGGALLEAAIECLNKNSKIILCGLISQYNSKNYQKGPDNFYKLNSKHAELIGYIVTDYEYLFDEFYQNIIKYISEGKIIYNEIIVDGLENAWLEFSNLFKSNNIGKVLVAI